jgi:hypothetical protein
MFKEPSIQENPEQKFIPTQISAEDFALLEKKVETLDPNILEKYKEIDKLLTEYIIDYCKEFITHDQQSFLQRTRSLVPNDPAIIEELFQHRDNNITSITGKSILNGKYYLGYSQEVGGKQSFDNPDFFARHFWNGRIAVVPEIDVTYFTTQQIFPDKDLLISSEEFSRRYFDIEKRTHVYKGKILDLGEDMHLGIEQIATHNFAGTSVHERLHSIQDYDLPLPIAEAAIHYYESEILKLNNIPVPRHIVGMVKSAEYWGKLRDKYGQELDKFIFGNSQQKNEMLLKLSEDFTEEKMVEYFPKIAWETQKNN